MNNLDGAIIANHGKEVGEGDLNRIPRNSMTTMTCLTSCYFLTLL